MFFSRNKAVTEPAVEPQTAPVKSNKTAKPKTKFQKFKDFVSWVVLIVVIICCILTGFRIHNMRTTGEQAFLFGYRPALILTGSMEPYMMTRSLCMTQEITSPDDVEVGDVVSYHVNTNDGQTLRITHRVIAIENGLYYTKGDNNKVADGYALPFENLEAEVIGVWNGGVPVVNLAYWFAGKWEESYTGKLICLCAAVAVVCAYNLICIFCGSLWSLITRKKEEEDLIVESTSTEKIVDNGSEATGEDAIQEENTSPPDF